MNLGFKDVHVLVTGICRTWHIERNFGEIAAAQARAGTAASWYLFSVWRGRNLGITDNRVSLAAYSAKATAPITPTPPLLVGIWSR